MGESGDPNPPTQARELKQNERQRDIRHPPTGVGDHSTDEEQPVVAFAQSGAWANLLFWGIRGRPVSHSGDASAVGTEQLIGLAATFLASGLGLLGLVACSSVAPTAAGGLTSADAALGN